LGYKVTVVLVGKPQDIKAKVVQDNWKSVLSMSHSIETIIAHDSSLIPSLDADVAVDALLGIGVVGHLRPPVLQAVKVMNKMECFKVAVDLPTGINPDTGEILGEAVRADLTVTFHRPKAGLIKAKEYVGELVVADVGLPREAEEYAGPGDVILTRKPRPPSSHKGDFGRLLVIGGSETFSGAPALVALSALRTGVDLVYIAAPQKTAHDISCVAPDLITVKLEGDHLNPGNVATIERILEKCNAVVMGPGLGLHEETAKGVKDVLNLIEEAKVPLLLDADGLKAFAGFKHRVNFPLVLTPHMGEYEILTKSRPSGSVWDRSRHVQQAAGELNAVILLKGDVDIISDGVRVKLNFTGNPGMTVGGTGDTLSGIVGAFLAQGFSPFRSAVAGAFINGAAGDFVTKETGYHILPTDIVEWIPKVIEDPMAHAKIKEYGL
jgi:NAD(P)H-hydrate epimerase